MANKLNITVATLANIENGRVGIDMEKLYHFSLIYDVPIRIITSLIIEISENGNDNGLAGAVRYLKVLPEKD